MPDKKHHETTYSAGFYEMLKRVAASGDDDASKALDILKTYRHLWSEHLCPGEDMDAPENTIAASSLCHFNPNHYIDNVEPVVNNVIQAIRGLADAMEKHGAADEGHGFLLACLQMYVGSGQVLHAMLRNEIYAAQALDLPGADKFDEGDQGSRLLHWAVPMMSPAIVARDEEVVTDDGQTKRVTVLGSRAKDDEDVDEHNEAFEEMVKHILGGEPTH